MNGVVVIDTNLPVLLVVGSASKEYIRKHKRLQRYTDDDFDLLTWIIAQLSEIVMLPHVLAETSTLARQIENPARARIQSALRKLIATTIELPIQSVSGARRDEFPHLGLTDAVILHLCSMSISGIQPTLITVDGQLADAANAMGFSVVDYAQLAS